MSVVKMYLALAGSTWQWAAGHRSAAQGLSVICSGGGSVVMVLVALAVEFRTSPNSLLPFIQFDSVAERRHTDSQGNQ